MCVRARRYQCSSTESARSPPQRLYKPVSGLGNRHLASAPCNGVVRFTAHFRYIGFYEGQLTSVANLAFFQRDWAGFCNDLRINFTTRGLLVLGLILLLSLIFWAYMFAAHLN